MIRVNGKRTSRDPLTARVLLRNMDRFCLEVVFEAHHTAFATISGLLVPAKRRAVVERRTVYVNGPRAQPRCNTLGTIRAARLNIGGEAIGRVIGNSDRLVLGLERYDDQNRAKDFIASGFVSDIESIDQGGTYIEATFLPGDRNASAINLDLRSCLFSAIYITLDSFSR